MSTEVPSGRQRSFKECSVQSAILFRVGIYGTALTLYFIITLICTQCLSDPDRGFSESLMKCLEDVVYWLPGFVFLAPVVAHDLMKTINHVILPINRLQREMALLINDQSERPIALNEEEQWQELTESYNQLRGELLLLRKQVAENAELSTEPLPPSLLLNDEEEDRSVSTFSSATNEESRERLNQEVASATKTLPLDAPLASLNTVAVNNDSSLATNP
jgi:hypothetical protein